MLPQHDCATRCALVSWFVIATPWQSIFLQPEHLIPTCMIILPNRYTPSCMKTMCIRSYTPRKRPSFNSIVTNASCHHCIDHFICAVHSPHIYYLGALLHYNQTPAPNVSMCIINLMTYWHLHHTS